MANKEALRDLHQRLAERLQSAQTGADAAVWLAVRLADGHYLIPLAQAGEIFPVGNLTHVPYTQPWFAGVANLRGGLFGVVDLARFLSLSASVSVRDEAAWAKARLVTFNPELEVNVALIVDDLLGLRRPEMFQGMQPASEGAPAFFGNRYQDSQGAHWQEINVQQLSQTPAFLDIRV